LRDRHHSVWHLEASLPTSIYLRVDKFKPVSPPSRPW
jgi:hypothetical protein